MMLFETRAPDAPRPVGPHDGAALAPLHAPLDDALHLLQADPGHSLADPGLARLTQAGLANSANGKWAVVNVLSFESTAAGAAGVHVIGDASQCGLPKAGHVANQEAKICADAIVRALGGQQPDPAPVANSACYSPITASTASWLTAVYQYDAVNAKFVVANNGGVTTGATPVESATISSKNFQQMNTWFNTLMGDSFA